MADFALQRRQRILAWLRSQGQCSVADLSSRLGVSLMTIRRDLDELVREGHAIRTHGGAIPAEGVVFEFQFLTRVRERAAAKEAIGAAAAALVKDGWTVLLDSGSTTLAVASCLVGRQVTVITTSLPVAARLQHSPPTEILLLGGRLRRDTPDLWGGLTLRMLEWITADVAFLGAEAVDESGWVYTSSADLAPLLERMAGVSERVYIVADSSKLGRRGPVRFGDLKKWAGLITDAGVAASLGRRLGRHGVRVIVAKGRKGEERP